ncbi:interleukin-31 receptor subunit alpha-like isoform 2-T2 [Odontesthes bonariensis]|uniref:interleukin-31 receptor subunit alpha-like isoform X2 n=1 Tax=Odontesthes bonariensis TaxID=219752 RepID=UPI003F5871C8
MFPFFVPFIIVFISSICKGQHDNTCNVFPKDQYIEVGSSTEIFCQTSCVNGKVFWTLNNEKKDESLSKTINSTHTVFLLRNFTSPSATLQCHSAHKQVLGGTIIRAYSKPSNISCHLHYKSQEDVGVPGHFTCRWENQINPSVKINYTVLYAQPSSVNNWSEICMSNVPQCTSKDDKLERVIKIFWSNKFTVIIRAETAAWEADSDPYEFYSSHIWKINYPEVAVTAFSEYLLVKWKLNQGQGRVPEKRHCQVKYTKASLSKGDTSKVLDQYLYSEGPWNTTIEEVESCMNYSIRMRCALDNAPWSNWSPETTLLTKLNKKHVMLHLWRKVTELGKNGKRKVRVMWMDIPSTCKETMNYTIKQIPLMTGNYTSTSCSGSTCDVDVDQHAHRINLTVSHDEVFTEESIYVPAIGESLPKVTDIQTSNDEGVIAVSWKAPIPPVRGYMIDWTQNGIQYYWRESSFTNTTLDDLLDKKPYNITITPILDDRTGHSTQALQICSRVGDPGHVEIKDVQFYDKSANVSWETKSHDACSGAVISYMVFYKDQNGQLNVTVDGNYVFLKDLTPDTQYTVYVEAKAHTGKTRSKERIFRTTLFDPRLIIVLSICGSIIILLVLSLGLFCVIQWKKCSKKPVPNPGHSSVATWLSQSQQKDVCPFQPYNNPSDGLVERVYTEETHEAFISSIAADSNGNTAMEQTQEYSDSTMTHVSAVEKNRQAEHAETHFKSSPGESAAFLSTESRPVSPYRSQSFVESPVPRTSKQRKQASGKQPEKTTMKTIYVSLDMFEPADVW